MTCLICGGQTLSGAKLCKPCRAALRRARDDTVSELMPLPRRMDALAWQQPRGASAAARFFDLGNAPALAPTSLSQLLERARTAPLRAVGLLLLVLAVGSLAFTATWQVRLESEGHEVRRATPAPVHQPSVSPTTLAAAARAAEVVSTPGPAVESEPAAPVSSSPTRPRADSRRVAPARVAPPASKAAAEPVAAARIEQPAASVPVVATDAASPKGDRWQRLSNALAGCNASDLFKRASCEHAVRVQYCDGYWGQSPLCPDGVSNDRGQ